MYKCKHFKIYELVDPVTYEKYGEGAWKFFDIDILVLADALRERYGPCTVNDWFWGGKFIYSGYRPSSCRIGAKMSLHRFFRALDMKFKNISAAKVRKGIRDDMGYWEVMGLKRVENKVNWLHIDTANVNPVRFFNP